MISTIIDKIKERRCLVEKAGITVRTDYPPDVRKWINEYGEKKITKIVVCRKPVQKYIKTVLNGIALGKFNKNIGSLNYDDLFHLYIYMTIDGKNFILEKNEVIQVTKTNDRRIKEDCRHVSLIQQRVSTMYVRNQPQSYKQLSFGNNPAQKKVMKKEMIHKILTLRKFMHTALTHGSKKTFFSYHPQKANCQFFISRLLLSNGLIKYGDEIHKFIQQDGDAIFKDIKYVGVFGRRITDLAHTIDIIKQGC